MDKNMNKPNPSQASVLQQPKVPPVSVPQQPKSQMSGPRQIQDIPRSKPTPAAAPTHDDIAKRAYEIYVQKGDRQGDSEQNWKQAEQELKK